MRYSNFLAPLPVTRPVGPGRVRKWVHFTYSGKVRYLYYISNIRGQKASFQHYSSHCIMRDHNTEAENGSNQSKLNATFFLISYSGISFCRVFQNRKFSFSTQLKHHLGSARVRRRYPGGNRLEPGNGHGARKKKSVRTGLFEHC